MLDGGRDISGIEASDGGGGGSGGLLGIVAGNGVASGGGGRILDDAWPKPHGKQYFMRS